MDYKNRAVSINGSVIKERILAADKIVITVHIHPDGDALGSMLALYEYIKGLGKDVHMVIDDVVPAKFQQLPFVEEILSPKDWVFTREVDLLLVLDASTYERIGYIGEMFTCHMLNIDHHVSNTKYAHELYLQPKAAATGEILVDLFKEWQVQLTPTMGNALYLAIATDCGFFKYGNTTEKTLAAAAQCVGAGASPQNISDMVDVSTEERLKAIGLALQTVRFYGHGKIASICVNQELMRMVNEDTDGFVELVRSVEGVDVSILFKEYGTEKIRISFRSKSVDVNKLASHFGGGGHIRAAGCSVKLPLDEAVKEVVKFVEQSIVEEA